MKHYFYSFLITSKNYNLSSGFGTAQLEFFDIKAVLESIHNNVPSEVVEPKATLLSFQEISELEYTEFNKKEGEN